VLSAPPAFVLSQDQTLSFIPTTKPVIQPKPDNKPGSQSVSLAAEAKPKKPARSENLATGSLKLNLPRFPEIRRQTAHIKPPPAHPFHIHTNRVKEHSSEGRLSFGDALSSRGGGNRRVTRGI
jgi:hypothetical protein